MSRRNRRRYAALLALFGLLFQQAAIAAYACAMTGPPPVAESMPGDCGAMAMEAVVESPAVCAKHCAPDRPVMPDAPTLGVPPLAISPVHFALATVPPGSVVPGDAPPAPDTGPPPRVRYCSLLI